jgi:hypothetical protein
VAYCAECGWTVAQHPPLPPGAPPPPGPAIAPVAPERAGFRGQLPAPAPDPWADYRLRLNDIEVSLPYLPSHRDFVRSCVRHVATFVLNAEFMTTSCARFVGEGDLAAPMKRSFRLAPDPPGAQGAGLRSACWDLERLGRHILGLLWCVAHHRMSSPRESIPVAKTLLGLSSEISAIEWIWDRGAIAWDFRMTRPPAHVLHSWHYLIWWGLNFALLLPEEWPEAFVSFTVEVGEAYYQKNKEFFTDRGTWAIKFSKEAVAARVRSVSSDGAITSRRKRFRSREAPPAVFNDTSAPAPPPPPPPPMIAAPATLPIGPAAAARRISASAPLSSHAGRGGGERGGKSRGRGRFGRGMRAAPQAGGRGAGGTPATSGSGSAGTPKH